jgi:hypothetical protein
MYLTGERYLWNLNRQRGDKKAELIDLGYWRKHPNLHGFIVRTFADGIDECQRIELTRDDIRLIIAAIGADDLPFTTGFFFGESDGSEKASDLITFNEALQWLDAEEEDTPKSIYYQASW